MTEAPNWYQEKEEAKISDNRINTAFSDAAKDLDMFAPGVFSTVKQVPKL